MNMETHDHRAHTDPPVRVLVCGGRDYDDAQKIGEVLQEFPCETIIVHGAAPGADHLAGVFWGQWGETEPHPADWAKHGKAAGPIRNQEMLDTGIDLVIAFPGGRGTADMVRRALKAGVEVREIQ